MSASAIGSRIDQVRRASNLVLRFPLDIQVMTMFT
jgi:hypothetical protein